MGKAGQAVWLGLMGLVMACTSVPDRLQLTPLTYNEIPGWPQAVQATTLALFQQTCSSNIPDWRVADAYPDGLTDRHWQKVCEAAQAVPANDDQAARHFFERHFTPYQVMNHHQPEGLFTGYYIPVLRGSIQKDTTYRWPAYAMPEQSEGKSLPERAAIDGGALEGQELELLWLDDPVALFFAHIQGSAFVELPDGKRVKLAYAGKNGHPYHAIGRTLIDWGELEAQNVSMPAILAWLREHPKRRNELLHTNPSYVFFSLEQEAEYATGSHGTALMAEHSLAVDRAFLPLGSLLMLSTSLPDSQPFHRLMVAQDTGSAIKGPVRGDIFFGYGAQPGRLAGKMNASGRLAILLPEPCAGPE